MDRGEDRLIVIRGLPLSQDSRTRRHLLSDHAVKQVITWEDEGPQWLGMRTGRRQYPIALSYPIWLLRLFLMSLLRFRKGDTVICMDLDTYLPVRLGRLLGRPAIFLDIVDPIAQTRFRRVPGNRLFDWIEFAILRFSSRVIVPGTSRIDYYFDRLGISRERRRNVRPPIVVENVATFAEPDREQSLAVRRARSGERVKTLAYFGGLSESRGLREMCEHFAGVKGIRVLIAGRGSYEEEIRHLAERHSNVEYLGAFDYGRLSTMLAGVDFYWAYYDPSVLLHRYAYPNKFYEHLAFRVPIIINRCVPQSVEVARLRTGIVIDDDLSNATFRGLKRRMRSFDAAGADFLEWERTYQNYKFGLNRA